MIGFKAGIVVMGVFFAGSALAIQPGKTVTWDTPMGKEKSRRCKGRLPGLPFQDFQDEKRFYCHENG